MVFVIDLCAQPFALLGLCEVDGCCRNKTDEAGRKSCLIGYPNGFHKQDQYRLDHPRCGTNGTCYPSVCTCYANNMGYKSPCAVPLNAICNGVTDVNGKQWGFEGCYRDYPDYPDLQLYFKTAYCEIARCYIDGGSYASCYCQVYKNLCEVFGDVRKYHVSQYQIKSSIHYTVSKLSAIYFLCIEYSQSLIKQAFVRLTNAAKANRAKLECRHVLS